MPKINYPIPEQNFEKISSQIGVILKEELPSQYADLNDIWLERIVPFDKTEIPCVNVMYAGSRYSGNDRHNSDSEDTFLIDVYENAKSTNNDRGDALANVKLKSLIGKIRYILESVEYERLDFATPLVRHTEVEEININEPEKTGDGLNNVMGRLTFKAMATESVDLQQPTPAGGYDTQVKLEETEKGYKFVKNNP